jgi:ribonuclease HI
MGKPVVNRDLWEHLLKLYALHSVAFKHVKGHSGIKGNERCDELCTQEMLTVYAAMAVNHPDVADLPVDTKGKLDKTTEAYA